MKPVPRTRSRWEWENPPDPAAYRPLHPEEAAHLRDRIARMQRSMIIRIVVLAFLAGVLLLIPVHLALKAVALAFGVQWSLIYVGLTISEQTFLRRAIAEGVVAVTVGSVGAVYRRERYFLVGTAMFTLRDRRELDSLQPGMTVQIEHLPKTNVLLRLNGRPIR